MGVDFLKTTFEPLSLRQNLPCFGQSEDLHGSCALPKVFLFGTRTKLLFLILDEKQDKST